MPYEINGNGIAITKTKILDNELLRSTEVNEIISNQPGFLIRWGVSIFFLILVLLVLATWFVQYPDIVTTKATLTSINAPKSVITKTQGKLIQLLVKEGQMVQQKDILGYVESTASHTAMLHFLKAIDSVQILLAANKTEEGINYFKSFSVTSYLQSNNNFLPPNGGEIEGAVSVFMQAFILFNQYVSAGYYIKKKRMLQSDINYLQQLHTNLLQQKSMQQQDVNLAKETFNANQTLKEDKVISPLDYRNEKSKYIGKALSIPQISLAIISNQSSQHEKQKEILQLENDIAQQKGIFTQALHTLKAQLEEWKNKYVLIAPVTGKIAFATFLQENQQLQANQIICFVNPENSQYYAEVYIPQTNFGKVKVGQQVLLKFPAYPFQEYGSIKGKIDFISNITTDSGYLAKVTLPAGLNTTYKKVIQFREGLTAQGEIITADMRLLQRFYYSIVKQVQ
jgi:multidrug efflux pump subunit AcrA (membrane-fusion protein)